MKKIAYITAIPLMIATGAFSQETAPAAEQSAGSGDLAMNLLIVAFILTALLVLLASVSMLKAFRIMADELNNPKPYLSPEEVAEKSGKDKPGIWSKILGLRPLSEEKDLMIEHEFDGITELDNPTPAWFMWLFYGSIAFAFIYLMYFPVLNIGLTQEEEYAIELAEAEASRKAFLANSANNIDENSVTEDTSAPVIAAGKSLYDLNCLACHGDQGQGLVGPNLADEYWIHGGSINDIFRTIKYGVPEKGMISWEKTLTPKQISDVSNYIMTMKGTNPPNPKAPQGEKEG